MITARRKKRTRSEVEEDITKVTLSLIEDKGFIGLTLTGIAKAAKVEPSVFYNRFATLEHCLDNIVRKYDYWFSNIFQDYQGDLYSKEGYKYILKELFSSLSDNRVMQHLLSWELAVNNETTVRTAKLREFHTIPLDNKFHELFKDTTVDIRAVSSLIVGGIYYLVLHRDLCTFCEIDVNSPAGKERIVNTINYLAEKLFSELSFYQEKLEIARKLKTNKVESKIIAECMELPLTTVENL